MGNAVEQHLAGLDSPVAMYQVEAQRRFARIQHHARGTQFTCPGFEGCQQATAVALPLPVGRDGHVTDLCIANTVEVQATDTRYRAILIDDHQVCAAVIQRITFTAARLLPGGAQDFPAQGVVLPEVFFGNRLDDVQVGGLRRR